LCNTFALTTDRVITDHTRTVNRVCWNPFDHNGLLSGSQDGTMKLWARKAFLALL